MGTTIKTAVMPDKRSWTGAIIIIISVVAIALLGGIASDVNSPWYQGLQKPTWQPPSYLFGPVWTTLYVLGAISAIIIWKSPASLARRRALTIYAINGALNLAWSWIFFQGHTALWAGVEIGFVWLTILLMIRSAWPISRTAAWLLVPYLLWVSFATVLTWAIVSLN